MADGAVGQELPRIRLLLGTWANKGKKEGPGLVRPDPSWFSKVLLFVSSRSPL
jgi:hypothetical protein